MKILLAALGIPGHLNPILAAATVLSRHHDVKVMTSAEFAGQVKAAGLSFIAEPEETSSFVGKFVAEHPPLLTLPAGNAKARYGLEHYVANRLDQQAASLTHAIDAFFPDVVIADSVYFGTLPFLLREREGRPAIVHLGITVLNSASRKFAYRPADVSEDAWKEASAAYEEEVVRPVQEAFNRSLAALDRPSLDVPALSSLAELADLYLHTSVRGFEYPTQASRVRFIGRLPMPQGNVTIPDWWQGIPSDKRVVLVTQGTIANRDFGELVLPTLRALEHRDDLVVVVTTGGPAPDVLGTDVPTNARTVPFLPYEAIMPRVDILVTNGGYGTVNMAASHGIPVISAGMTEDKEEVSALVQWSGIGIDLRTQRPSVEQLRDAVSKVLDDPSYRQRAEDIAREYAACPSEDALLEAIATFDPARGH